VSLSSAALDGEVTPPTPYLDEPALNNPIRLVGGYAYVLAHTFGLKPSNRLKINKHTINEYFISI